MRLARFSSAVIGAVLLSGPVVAQTAPGLTTSSKATSAHVATTTKTTKTNAPVQRTANSLDCSKQADSKNIHGKTRKSFMLSCKKP